LEKKVAKLPWCMEPLRDETSSYLLQPLKVLNRHGFLTINSQPQVNAARSDDLIVGWGSKHGFVYQKAYLEFFCSKPALMTLLTVVERRYPSLTYQAINRDSSEYYLNCANKHVNAVTWGVFPGQEILQPTIVDTDSFKVWKDEAFGLWTAYWASIYSEEEQGGAQSLQVLNSISSEWFLVNIVENDYVFGDIMAPFRDYFRVTYETKNSTMVQTSKDLDRILSVLSSTKHMEIGSVLRDPSKYRQISSGNGHHLRERMNAQSLGASESLSALSPAASSSSDALSKLAARQEPSVSV